MSIGNLIGDVDLFRNPIEEEEAQKEYERKVKEAAEAAKKQAREAQERAKEQEKNRTQYNGPDGKNVPKTPKPPEKPPEVPKPPEPPKPPDESTPDKRKARDGQSLDQQSPGTQAAFLSKYGDKAHEEWTREHEKELDRNIGTYGVEEPKAGTKALQPNTPDAPDRTIGRYQDPSAPAGEAQRPPGSLPTPPSGIPGSPGVSATNPMVTATTPRDPNMIAPSSWKPPTPTQINPPSGDAQVGNPSVSQVSPPSGDAQVGTGSTSAIPTSPTNSGHLFNPSIPGPPGSTLVDATPQGTTPPAAQPPPGAPTKPIDPGDYILVQSPGGIQSWMTRESWNTKSFANPQGGQTPWKDLFTLVHDPKSQRGAPSAPAAASPTAPVTAPAVQTPAAPATAPTVQTPVAPTSGEPSSNILPTNAPPAPPGDMVYARSYNGLEGWFRRDELSRQHAILFDPKKSGEPFPADGSPGPQPELAPPATGPQPLFPRDPLAPAMPGVPADPFSMAAQTTKPVDTIVQLNGKNPDEALHILNGINALMSGDKAGAWTEPYLNDVARLAWSKEELQNGRNSDPRDAPLDYIETWKDGFFGSDPNIPLVKEVDQQMIDYGVHKAALTGKPYDWRDSFGATGEGGLISRQTTSIDCGPNAISTVLRSMGYGADPGQTFQYAKDKGYHDGNQFTGPNNFARMLTQEAGVQAEAIPVDWRTIDSELAAGRVVTLSSPGHYWSVSARRDGANGPEYYTGATGSTVRNPEWASPGQLAYNGAPNTMIVTRGAPDPNSPIVRTLGLKPPVAGPMPQNRAMLSAMTLSSKAKAENVIAMQARQDPAHQPQTVRMSQYSTDEPPPAAGPAAQTLSSQPQQQATDPRILDAAKENLWSNNQSNRQTLMVDWNNRPREEREADFNAAIERGLDEEGITDPSQRDAWRTSMRMVVTGEGLNRGVHGENPDLNPYMLSGESGGRPGTANRANSSALGYFQFLRQNPNGSLYSHASAVPDEYKDNPYDPVGQVRQYIRLVSASKKAGYNGDPMGPVKDKNATGVWGP